MFRFLNIHLKYTSHPDLQDQNCFSFEAWGLVLPPEYLKSIIKTRHTDNQFCLILLTSTPPCFHKIDIYCIKKNLVFNYPHFNNTFSHLLKTADFFYCFLFLLWKPADTLYAFSVKSKILILSKCNFFQFWVFSSPLPKTFWSSAVLTFWHILVGTFIIFFLIYLSWISPESCCPFT